MLHLPQTELLSRWRQDPDPGTMVALCNELAVAAERRPGSVNADLVLDVGREAEAHYPGHFEVLLAVGRLLLASGQLHRALKPLIEAARLASEPRALRFLGEVFLRLGDARHATMAFERAVKRGGGDEETRGWLEAAKGYLPLQEAHGTDYVAKELARSQEAARSGGAVDREVDDTTATRDLAFRRPLPSASEITGDGLPDLSSFEDEKTDVMSMSRVVAAIQHVPPAAREQFLAMMKRPASQEAGQPAARPQSGVDFDLDREGLSDGELLDEESSVAATRQIAVSPLSSYDDEVKTQVQRAANEVRSGGHDVAAPVVSGALAAAADRLKGRPAPGPIAPAGPLPATSALIIPVALDGAAEPAPRLDVGRAPAAPVVEAAPAPVVAAPEPARVREVPKTKVSGEPPRIEPKSPYIEAPSRRPPAQVVVRRPRKKSKLGIAPIAGFAVLTMLATTFVGLRLGRLPGLAQRLPPWVSGMPAPVSERAPEPVEEPVPEDEAPAGETAPVELASQDPTPTAEPTDPPPDPTADATAEPTAEPVTTAEPTSEPVATPPPVSPPPKKPPPQAPPPKPVAQKPPPPKEPPKQPEPPKAPPPPAPDVVWLGDPELKVPD